MQNFSILSKALIFLLSAYVSLVLVLYFSQRKIIFAPDKIRIESVPRGFIENYLVAADGTRLYSWYHDSKLIDLNHKLLTKFNSQQNHFLPIKVILYLQGNAGSLLNREERASAFAKSGLSVLMLSYRGYANSEGNPSESGLVADGRSAMNFLISQGFKESEILLYGESIGSGVAVQLAAEFSKIAMLVLEAPFTSAVAVANHHYWFVPVSWLLKDRFDSAAFAAKISSPTLIFHAYGDSVVPFLEGWKLFEKFSSPKHFVGLQGNFHIDLAPKTILQEIGNFNQQIQPNAQHFPKNHQPSN